MLIMDYWRYSLNKNCKVIFADIVLLKKVVKFIGVNLIPNEEGDADGYEDEIEDRQGYHRLFELSFMSIGIREQLEHILQTKSAHFWISHCQDCTQTLAKGCSHVVEIDYQETHCDVYHEHLDEVKVEGYCGGKQIYLCPWLGVEVWQGGIIQGQLYCIYVILAAWAHGSITSIFHFGTAVAKFMRISMNDCFLVVGRILVHSIHAVLIAAALCFPHELNFYYCGYFLPREIIYCFKVRISFNSLLSSYMIFILLPIWIYVNKINKNKGKEEIMRNRGNSSKSGSKNSRKASSQYDFSEDNFQTPRAKSAKNHGNFGSAQSVMLSTIQNHPDECLCKDCLCGRHLCKFASPTPSMTLASTYKRHYPPRTPYKHQQAQRPASAKLP